MRRGLMRWDPEELPVSTLRERVWRLQAAMKREGFDALLIYTNFVRPSAMTYLTGFTPYWSDGIMMLLTSGEPVFATALSKRVANWIRLTDPVGEILNTPRPGEALGRRLAAERVKKVGVVELDSFPAGLHDEIKAAAPGLLLADASALFAASRRLVDPLERQLIKQADNLARSALDEIDPLQASEAGAVAALIEKHARYGGAEEIHVAVAPDLDRDRRLLRVSKPRVLGSRFAVRASVAYKGSWVRRTRTFARDAVGGRPAFRAEAWLNQIASLFFAGRPLAAQIAAHLKTLPGAELKRWTAESSIGSYPLQVIASSDLETREAPASGDFVVLTVELLVERVPWIGAVPLIVGAPL